MGLFTKIKEKKQKQAAERALKIQAEKERLASLSEKELMIEMILKLNEISDKCDDIESTIITWS